MHTPTSIRFIRTTKRRGFDSVGVVSVAGTPQLLQVISRVPELAQLAVAEIDVTYGLDDLPVTLEKPKFYIAVVDSNNIPSEPTLSRNAEWVSAQHWVVATGGAIVNTLNSALLDFLNPIIHSTIDIFDRSANLVLATIISSSTTSDMAMLGKILFNENLMQRRWADDTSWDDYKGLFYEEVFAPLW